MPAYRTAFISHAHADNDRCKSIAEKLRARGVDLWIDLKNMQTGHALGSEITRELVQRQAFVLLATPASDTSPWVGNELDTYLAYCLNPSTESVYGVQRKIIPVLLTPIAIQPGAAVANWAKVYGRMWIDGVGKPDDLVADQIANALLISRQPQQDQQPGASGQTPFRTSGPMTRTPQHTNHLASGAATPGGVTPPPYPVVPHPQPHYPKYPQVPPTAIATAAQPDHFPLRLGTLGYAGGTVNGVEVMTPPLCNVPDGPFLMGNSQDYSYSKFSYNLPRDAHVNNNEKPEHTISLAAYLIARYPVTVAEYACYVRATGKQPFDWNRQVALLEHPIVNVTWHDAVAYAAWLAQITGQPWRLSTEAEWEKAARTIRGAKKVLGIFTNAPSFRYLFPWGETWDRGRANTSESELERTTPVGAYPTGASPCGAQDMTGNVWEWTSSLRAKYPYNPIVCEDPNDRTSDRVTRGGSWDTDPGDARVTCRNPFAPTVWNDKTGFRLAISI